MADMDLSKLKVAQLKEELVKRGESSKGLKNELLDRLKAAIAKEEGGSKQETAAEGEETVKDVQEDIQNIAVEDALAGDDPKPEQDIAVPAPEITESTQAEEPVNSESLPSEPQDYKFSEGAGKTAFVAENKEEQEGKGEPIETTTTKEDATPQEKLVQTTLPGASPRPEQPPIDADMQIDDAPVEKQDNLKQTTLDKSAVSTTIVEPEATTSKLTTNNNTSQENNENNLSKQKPPLQKRQRSYSRSRSRSRDRQTSSRKKTRRSLSRSRSISRSRSRSYSRSRSRSPPRRSERDSRRRSYSRSRSPPPRPTKVPETIPGPPSSSSLYLANLVRPFMVPTLKELLSEFGELDFFWIDAVKSHVYITYKEESQAKEAHRELNSVQWPANTGKNLSLTFVPNDRVDSLVSEEDQAKILRRGRLELLVENVNSEWTYRLVPFGTTPQSQQPISTTVSNGTVIPMRGLASAVPLNARGISISTLPSASQLNSRIDRDRPPLTGSNGFGVRDNRPLPYGRDRDDSKQRDESKFRSGRTSSNEKWTRARPSVSYKPYKE